MRGFLQSGRFWNQRHLMTPVYDLARASFVFDHGLGSWLLSLRSAGHATPKVVGLDLVTRSTGRSLVKDTYQEQSTISPPNRIHSSHCGMPCPSGEQFGRRILPQTHAGEEWAWRFFAGTDACSAIQATKASASPPNTFFCCGRFIARFFKVKISSTGQRLTTYCHTLQKQMSRVQLHEGSIALATGDTKPEGGHGECRFRWDCNQQTNLS